MSDSIYHAPYWDLVKEIQNILRDKFERIAIEIPIEEYVILPGKVFNENWSEIFDSYADKNAAIAVCENPKLAHELRVRVHYYIPGIFYEKSQSEDERIKHVTGIVKIHSISADIGKYQVIGNTLHLEKTGVKTVNIQFVCTRTTLGKDLLEWVEETYGKQSSISTTEEVTLEF